MRHYVRQVLRAVLRNEEGATLVEYSLLLALIAMACTATITGFGCRLARTLLDAAEVFGS